jgi:hypothetical protein
MMFAVIVVAWEILQEPCAKYHCSGCHENDFVVIIILDYLQFAKASYFYLGVSCSSLSEIVIYLYV